jgi:hypothetical protein
MLWKSEVLQIPFEHVWLPGYLMQPASTDLWPRTRRDDIVNPEETTASQLAEPGLGFVNKRT